ncbi:AAA domain-containing protein [Carbonactinospora thermoautotrophica]|uniref:AAA domain-containing protein n=1 Tax=Carbonactinospora thermoautotrophica TaxID=1469144 RepID=UPI003DA906A2
MDRNRTPPAPIGEMRRALEIEIAVCRRSFDRTAPKALLRDGVRGANGETDCYRFAFDQWPPFREDRYLLIHQGYADGCDEEWYPAEVVHLDRHAGTVTLRTHTDLGDRPAHAQLREDDARLLERLYERLGEAVGERSRLNLAMSRLVLGEGGWAVSRERHPDRYVRGLDRFDAAQRDAVAQALASTVTFVWGPPGAGKTDVVAAVVEGAVRLGHRVLLLAPTNVAVDQALSRVCERLADHPDFDHGLIQRHGPIQLQSLDERYGDRVDHRRTAERLTAELDARIARLRERHSRLSDQIPAYERVEDLRKQIRFDNAQHAGHRILLDRIERDLAALDRRIAEVQRHIDQLHPLTWLRFRSLRELLQRRDELREEAEVRQAALIGPQQRLAAIDQHRQAVRAELERAEADLADPDLDLHTLRRQLADCERELAEVRGQRRALLDDLTGRCRVHAATTVKAYSSRLPEADVVVVDEAGMVDLAEAFYVAGLARKRVVFAGDFRQLPAIVNGHTDARTTEDERNLVRTWLARDVFTAAGLVDANGLVVPDSRLASLAVQYRMHEDICTLVNTVAYPDAPLRTGRRGPPSARSPSSPLAAPLVLVDTSEAGAHSGRPTYNLVHAVAIQELVRRVRAEGALLPAEAQAAELRRVLAVIAPYREQVAQLALGLTELLGAPAAGLVDTVHRFQGSQRPVVIVDTTEACAEKLGPFYGETGLRSRTTRLLNVALSRAADHLVVVANVAHLRANLPPGSEVATLLDHLEDHAHRIPLERLVPLRTAGDLADLAPEELARPAFFPARECLAAIRWDVERAERAIEIYCPFLNQTSVRHWIGRLRGPISRGVTVTVYTREPARPVERRLYEELAAAGCHMRPRRTLHEKVVIVDDVLWHGSLNLLAYWRSTDLMMRLASSMLCDQVRRVVHTARPGAGPAERRRRPQGPPPPAPTWSGGRCPRCGVGKLVIRRRRDNGHAFWACTEWRGNGATSCTYTRSLDTPRDARSD